MSLAQLALALLLVPIRPSASVIWIDPFTLMFRRIRMWILMRLLDGLFSKQIMGDPFFPWAF